MNINWKVPKSSEDLPLVPLSALTKIGAALFEATEGRIQYQIARSQKTATNEITHQFYLSVPALQDFKLLAIQTDAMLIGYPVKVFDLLGGATSTLDVLMGKPSIIAKNPQELSEALKNIVESERASLVIGSLLAEIEAQSTLNIDRFGQMRPR